MSRLILGLLIIFLVFISACTIDYSKACFNGKCIDLEVMNTDEEKAKGLMFRESLDEDKGLLFLYFVEGERNFWMKNVKFPIDIIWLDKNNEIIHIERDVPGCLEVNCPTYSAGTNALNVIEVNANFTLENNINVGDIVRLI